MKTKIYQLLAVMVAVLVGAGIGWLVKKPKQTSALRILDIQLVDGSTGLPPKEGWIQVEPPTPEPDGPYFTVLQGAGSEFPYTVRLTWVQHDLADQKVLISVEGYEQVQLGMKEIETLRANTSVVGLRPLQVMISPAK